MKRQIALLFALTFMVSGMATVAEQTDAAVENENAAVVEEAWVAPFEDGAWLGVPELSAEVYLPAGWVVDEVTENGFTAIDAEAISSVTVTLADFVETEIPEAEASEEETEDENDSIELSAFENYLIGLGQEYELALMGEREAAIISSEESLTVMFVQNERLVTMVFAPAAEGSIADSALAVAETFYVYPEMTENEGTAEENAAE